MAKNGGKKVTRGRGRPKGSLNKKGTLRNRAESRLVNEKNNGNNISPAKSTTAGQDDIPTPITKHSSKLTKLTDAASTSSIAASDSTSKEKNSSISLHGKDMELNDQTTTLKSSEKPPKRTEKSFKAAVNDTIHLPMSEFTHKSTFQLQKNLYEDKSDDSGNTQSKGPTEYHHLIRMTMMFKIP